MYAQLQLNFSKDIQMRNHMYEQAYICVEQGSEEEITDFIEKMNGCYVPVKI